MKHIKYYVSKESNKNLISQKSSNWKEINNFIR